MAESARREGMQKVLVDPGAVLVRDPGLIVDPRFLAPLCQELTADLGPAKAGTALVQIGCMHGLRDAQRVVTETFAAPSAHSCTPSSSALPIQLRSQPSAGADGRFEIEGSWPEAAEAQAWLSHQPAADGPVCAVSAGYTAGWLSGLFEAEIVAVETACSAAGAPQCRFLARDAASWRASGEPRALAMLDALPIEALRDALDGNAHEGYEPALTDAPAGETVIHIWGPVMVIPFGGLDEAIQAVELLRSDPSAARVSVIVMDLTGAIVDEAFGAAALEQIIECAEECGADTVLAGVSPLSEAVVASLDRQPILVCKDLHAGIAAGFQVADSQQRLL